MFDWLCAAGSVYSPRVRCPTKGHPLFGHHDTKGTYCDAVCLCTRIYTLIKWQLSCHLLGYSTLINDLFTNNLAYGSHLSSLWETLKCMCIFIQVQWRYMGIGIQIIIKEKSRLSQAFDFKRLMRQRRSIRVNLLWPYVCWHLYIIMRRDIWFGSIDTTPPRQEGARPPKHVWDDVNLLNHIFLASIVHLTPLPTFNSWPKARAAVLIKNAIKRRLPIAKVVSC